MSAIKGEQTFTGTHEALRACVHAHTHADTAIARVNRSINYALCLYVHIQTYSYTMHKRVKIQKPFERVRERDRERKSVIKGQNDKQTKPTFCSFHFLKLAVIIFDFEIIFHTSRNVPITNEQTK